LQAYSPTVYAIYATCVLTWRVSGRPVLSSSIDEVAESRCFLVLKWTNNYCCRKTSAVGATSRCE